MSVILYEHANFRGAHKHINGRSEANLHQDGWGDRVSSIQVLAGSWEFWQHTNFRGSRVILGRGNYPWVGSVGISNDSLSSVQRRGSWPPLMRTPGLILYENANFRGRHKHIINYDEPNLHVDGWGDRISSFQIISGLWRFCQNVNFGGWSTVLGPGNYPWLGAVGISNDQLSSIQQVTPALSVSSMPSREMVLYEHIDFRGDHKHLINRGEQNLHADGWGDRATSLQIISGTRWTLHEHINYSGTRANPPTGSHRWIRDVGMENDRLSSVRANMIPVYIKIIRGATTNIARDLNSANRTYNQYDIEVFSLGQETNTAWALLDLDQPTCFLGQTPTDEEGQLFDFERDHAPSNIVAYYLRSTSLGVAGCAAFPANRPGVVVANGASRWTFAHELGHVLGLSHVSNSNNLMFTPTASIPADPPVLTNSQLNTIRSSQYLV